MTSLHYRLVEGTHEIVACSLLEWAVWFKTADRHVAEDYLVRDVRVSTVFLGLDHRFYGDGPPLLFETMIFGGPHDGYQRRYATWDDAERGHTDACELVAGFVSIDDD